MTTTSNHLSAPSRGLLGALRNSIARDEVFAGLYILGCVNGLLGRILLAIKTEALTGLLQFDVVSFCSRVLPASL